jgi:hypothetical protein
MDWEAAVRTVDRELVSSRRALLVMPIATPIEMPVQVLEFAQLGGRPAAVVVALVVLSAALTKWDRQPGAQADPSYVGAPVALAAISAAPASESSAKQSLLTCSLGFC